MSSDDQDASVDSAAAEEADNPPLPILQQAKRNVKKPMPRHLQ
jgi:hypothetical protein